MNNIPLLISGISYVLCNYFILMKLMDVFIGCNVNSSYLHCLPNLTLLNINLTLPILHLMCRVCVTVYSTCVSQCTPRVCHRVPHVCLTV